MVGEMVLAVARPIRAPRTHGFTAPVSVVLWAYIVVECRRQRVSMVAIQVEEGDEKASDSKPQLSKQDEFPN